MGWLLKIAGVVAGLMAVAALTIGVELTVELLIYVVAQLAIWVPWRRRRPKHPPSGQSLPRS